DAPLPSTVRQKQMKSKVFRINWGNFWDSGANDNVLCTHKNDFFVRSHEFYVIPLFFRWSFTLVCRSDIKLPLYPYISMIHKHKKHMLNKYLPTVCMDY